MLEVAPGSADRLLLGITNAMDPVATFPRVGRMVPEVDIESLREMIYENYRIVYSIIADAVSVLSVFHASMDVAARLRELGISDA